MIHFKRLISVILALLMIISGAPLSVFALTPREDISGFYDSPDGDEYNLTWSYTASTDTLYLDGEIVESIMLPDVEEHLPLYYENENGEMVHWEGDWDGIYHNVVFSKNVKQLGRYCLGDNWVNDDRLNVSFEEGSKLERINSAAFHAYNINELIIPNTVTYIGGGAIAYCKINLLRMPKYNSAQELVLGDYAFTNSSFEEFDFNNCNISTISNSAFFSAIFKKSISIPSSVKTIGADAFHSADFYCDLTIPENVEVLDENAFYYAFADNLLFEGSIKNAKKNSFANTRFNKVTFNYPFEIIGQYAFRSCTTTEPSEYSYNPFMTSVDRYAFYESNINIINEAMDYNQYDISGTYNSEDDDYDLSWSYNATEDTLYLDGKIIKKVTYQDIEALPLFYKNEKGDVILWAGKYHNVVFSNSVEALEEDCLGKMHSEYLNISFEQNSKLERIEKKAFANYKLNSLILPDSVYYIGEYAFKNSTLEYIKLPKYRGSEEAVIERYAFYSCVNLEIDFNGFNIETINDYTFQYAEFKELTIPDSVKEIKYHAFSIATIDGNLIIPDSVETLGKYAFSGVTADSLYIGSGISEIPFACFMSAHFKNGVSISPDTYDLTIGSSAFSHSDIASFNITKAITSINGNAFSDCRNLTAITADDDCVIEAFKEKAFQNCIALESIEIPNSIKQINKDAFSGCSKLKTITFKNNCEITEINDGAFEGLSALENITIPDSVTKIGGSAFKNCTSLRELNIQDKTNIQEIGVAAFRGCTSLESVSLPRSIRLLPAHVFRECSALKSINLPNTIEEIGEAAFRGCTSLESISLPNNLASIMKQTFMDCSALTEIDIPYYVDEIGESAFENCESLVSFEMPVAVINVSSRLFYNDVNLESLTLSEYTTSIGSYAFYNCPKLETSIPNSVTSISEGAFYNFAKNISVPKNVTSIGRYAFYNSGIKSLDLSNCSKSISIGDYAFQNCEDLEYVSFENSEVKSFGLSAFENCSNLKTLEMPSNAPSIPRFFARNSAIENEIMIPYGVKTIGKGAFWRTNISGLYVPSTVTSIEGSAFEACTNLQWAEFDELDGVLSLGVEAFCGCSMLEEVNLPDGVITIPDSCFKDSGLTYVRIPNTVTKIEECAFMRTRLNLVEIPDNVLQIGSEAFKNCELLEEVEFTENSKLTSIFNNAFENDINLFAFSIPKAVEVVDYRAFYNCNLSRISIPEKCATVGTEAFFNNPLEKVTVYCRRAKLNTDCFGYNEDCVFYGYKESTAEKYALKYGLDFVLIDDSEPDPAPTGTWARGTWNVNEENRTLYISGNGDIVTTSIIDEDEKEKTFAMLFSDFEIDTVIVNDGITGLPDNFLYTEMGVNVNYIRLPNSLRSIGAHAFDGTSVKVFYNEARKKDVNNSSPSYIPKNVTSIGAYAFANTKGLSNDFVLSINLTEISEGLFYNSSIPHVEMYGKVKKLGKKAFANCSNLTTLYVPCSVTEIYTDGNVNKNAFGYCNGNINTDLWVVGRKDSKAYTYCNENGINFSEHRGLPYRSGYFNFDEIKWEYYIEDKTLILSAVYDKTVDSNWKKFYEADPDTNTIRNLKFSIKDESDWENMNLKPEKVIIEKTADFYAPYLLSAFNPKEIEVSNELIRAGGSTFANCTKVEELYFTNGMYYAGPFCFENCTSLKNVRLGYTITTLSKGLFSECRSLESVDLGNVVLQSIGEKAFYNCSSLKFVNLKNQTSYNSGSIGEQAFYNCVNLQEINIPDNIKTIKSKAFYNCVQAQRLNISGNVSSIEKDAFANLFYCEEINLNSEVNSTIFTDEKSIFSNLGAYTNGIELNVGSEVENLDCKFFDGLNVTKVNLGSGVKTLTNKQYLANLKEITADNNDVLSVKNGLLYNGNALVLAPQALTQITVDPETTIIDEYAFYGTNAKSIALPDSVEAIGESSFENSYALVGITLSEGLTCIPENAFKNCTKLRLLNLPENIVLIKESAFEGCKALVSAVFNNSLYTIGKNAFKDCIKLEGLAFPENLGSIQEGAFMNCSALKYAYIWNTLIGENAFANCEKLNIFTPVGSDAYRYAREFDIPYSAYTDEELFFDEWAIKIDAIAGYLGYCEEDGHGNIQYLTVYEADCEHDGYVIGVCEYCSEILEEIHTDAYGHDYRLETEIPATATTKGISVYTCENCNQSYTNYTPPTDSNYEIETHTVSGKVELSADKYASSGVAPAKSASVVINDMVVATTDENGNFSFELETGTYEAYIKYKYGFTRKLYIQVKNKDLAFTEPIAIIGCDFSKDGRIDDEDIKLFQMIISAKKNDPSYLSFVDMNGDGYINAKDLLYIKSCSGLSSDTFKYPVLIIS